MHLAAPHSAGSNCCSRRSAGQAAGSLLLASPAPLTPHRAGIVPAPRLPLRHVSAAPRRIVPPYQRRQTRQTRHATPRPRHSTPRRASPHHSSRQNGIVPRQSDAVGRVVFRGRTQSGESFQRSGQVSTAGAVRLQQGCKEGRTEQRRQLFTRLAVGPRPVKFYNLHLCKWKTMTSCRYCFQRRISTICPTMQCAKKPPTDLKKKTKQTITFLI